MTLLIVAKENTKPEFGSSIVQVSGNPIAVYLNELELLRNVSPKLETCLN